MSPIEKHSDIIVLAILWLVLLYTLQVCLSVGMLPPAGILLGFGIVLVLTVVRLFKMGGFKAVLATVLFLGSCYFFQIIFKYDSARICRYFFSIYYSFFPEETPKYYNKFWFEPVNLGILFIFLLLNSRVLWKSLKPKRGGEVEDGNHSILSSYNQSTNENTGYYIEKYSKELIQKDDEYLENIVATKIRWQKEYVTAAEKILSERTKNS